jgi:hypothetical protein
LCKCSQRLGENLHKTWINRCENFIKWEKENNITRKKKNSGSK